MRVPSVKPESIQHRCEKLNSIFFYSVVLKRQGNCIVEKINQKYQSNSHVKLNAFDRKFPDFHLQVELEMKTGFSFMNEKVDQKSNSSFTWTYC